jgi:hypothetical protein
VRFFFGERAGAVCTFSPCGIEHTRAYRPDYLFLPFFST